MRLPFLLCAALLGVGFTAAAQPADERPTDAEAGPAGVACVYPLKPFNYATICDFQVYLKDSAEGRALVLLEKRSSGVERSALRVADRVPVSGMGPATHDLMLGSCGRPGYEDPSIVALIARTDAYVVTPAKAWTVDFKARRIVEIPAQGLECLQGSGD